MNLGIRCSKTVEVQIVGFLFSKDCMNINYMENIDLMLEEKPKTLAFGAGLFSFPHPVEELAKIAQRD